MTFNVNQVVLDGFTQHDFCFTMLANWDATFDDIGKAVSLTANPAEVKLAADGDAIYGRIFQVEDRSQEGLVTVTVETRFRKRLPKAGATTMAIGDTAVGAGAGLVKSAGTDDPTANIVLAVATDYVIVEK